MPFTPLVETVSFSVCVFPVIQSAAEGSHLSGLTVAGGPYHTVMILHCRWMHRMVFLDSDAFFFFFFFPPPHIKNVWSKWINIVEMENMNKKSPGEVSSCLPSILFFPAFSLFNSVHGYPDGLNH